MKKNSVRLFIFSSLSVFSFINTVCIANDPNQLATVSYINKRLIKKAPHFDQVEINLFDEQLKTLEQTINTKIDETKFSTYAHKTQKNVETQLAKKGEKSELEKLTNTDPDPALKDLEEQLKELEQEANKKIDEATFSTYSTQLNKDLEKKLQEKVDVNEFKEKLKRKADISYVDKWHWW